MRRAVTRRLAAPLPLVLMLGVTCQVGQVVLLRELLMVFHGNEFSLGVILAAWMLWVGVGSRLGAAALQRWPDAERLLRLDTALVAIALPATVLLIRALPGIFDAPPGALRSLTDMAVASLTTMAPATLLLGAQFVLLSRIWRERDAAGAHPSAAAGGAARAGSSRGATGASKTYVGEAAGNTVGGLAFTLLLVHHLDAVQTALAIGATMLAAVLARRHLGAGLTVAVVGLALMPLASHLDGVSTRLQWRLQAPRYELLETYRSRYGTIAVLRHEDQVAFFQSGQLVFSTGGTDERAVGFEEQAAVTMAHLAMTQHPDPRRVLLVGGGLRGTLREVVRHGVERVDYVELDPVLLAAATPHLAAGTRSALADPRVRVVHTDGRLFVKAGGDAYDLIVVDLPDPTTAVLNRFYTEEFFAEAEARLRPGGVLVIGVTSTPDLRGTGIANRNATLYHTLRRVFPQVLAVGERHLALIATRDTGQVTHDARILARRYLERGVTSPAFDASHLALLLEPGPLERINWVLRHHGRSPTAHLEPPPASPLVPGDLARQREQEDELPPVTERFFVNADARPIGYYHTLLFWSGLTRADEAPALRWIARVEPWWALPPLALALAAAAWLRVRRTTRAGAGPRFAVLFAVFTTGLSTMTMQVALLFAFQSVYGFVYEMVGLIVAIFMAGLALGATLTRVLVRDPTERRALAAVQAVVAATALGIAWALPWAGGLASAAGVFVAFAVCTFVSGVLNGADFPLATASYLALDRRPERATATVYAVELAGGCLGAALASAVVAPVLGLVACCLLAAWANATAFAVLGVSGLRPARSDARAT
jgi:spermidine synthase